MVRPKKEPGTGLDHKVEARISEAEKKALDKLIAKRAALLLAQGVTGQDTFSAWLRGTIRTLAADAGEPVEEGGALAASSKKGGKAPRKAK